MTPSFSGSDLLALAERCEAATGPDRELDVAIALACGIVRERDGNCFFGHRDFSVMVLERGYYDHDGHAPELPTYTASIDAAMSLVPEGWGGKLFFSENRPDRELHCSATLARSYPTNADAYSEKSGKNGDRTAMALALIAAALRARAASTPSLNAEIAGMNHGEQPC